MKFAGKSLIALTLAGVMTLAVAPSASAEDAPCPCASGQSSTGTTGSSTREVKSAGGAAEAAAQLAAIGSSQGATGEQLANAFQGSSSNAGSATTTGGSTTTTGGSTSTTGGSTSTSGSNSGTSTKTVKKNASKVTWNGVVYYPHQDGIHWVTSLDRVGAQLTEAEIKASDEFVNAVPEDQRVIYVEYTTTTTGGSSSINSDLPNFGGSSIGTGNSNSNSNGGSFILETITREVKSELNGLNTDALISIGLPGALLIGGVMWYLNRDGQTYVREQSRVSVTPSQEEKQESEKMLENNKDNVKKQIKSGVGNYTEGDNGKRGMAAETGSNTVARTVFALLVMSILGSVAFVARRKFAN